MKIDLKVIINKIKVFLRKMAGYAGFIAVILVLAAYGFIVFRIRTLANHEPDSEVVSERLKNLKKPSIDQSTIDKIQQLQETNVQVKALFDQARDNPFRD
jgi:hypothetical protein